VCPSALFSTLLKSMSHTVVRFGGSSVNAAQSVHKLDLRNSHIYQSHFSNFNFFFEAGSNLPTSAKSKAVVMDRDTLMTEAVTEEKNASLFSPLNMDLKVELDALVQVLHRLPTSSQDMAALQAYAADLDHADKSQVLDSIARLMLRPDLTLYIVKTFRPLAIDLVARWLTPRFLDFLVSPDNFHTVYRIETMAKAFSIILPIVPQTKRYVTWARMCTVSTQC
jgi:hypothetical protein